jgi:hypothetical protein
VSAPGQDPGLLPATLLAAQLEVAETLVRKASGTESAAEAKDFAQASLFICQAVTTMDPDRLAGGETPEARKASTPTPPTRDTDRDGKVGEK